MGRKGGLGEAAMMDVIGQSAVASPLLQYKRDTVVNGTYAPAFTVQQIMKDFDLIAEVSRQDHCPMPLAAQIRQQYEAAFANGCGDRDSRARPRGCADRRASQGRDGSDRYMDEPHALGIASPAPRGKRKN